MAVDDVTNKVDLRGDPSDVMNNSGIMVLSVMS